jgi:asparagine synthase (glutamine-hydrolysing)
MAGFVGICGVGLKASNESLDAAVSATMYSGQTFRKDIYADACLSLKKSFVNFLELPKMMATQEDLYVWVDGEIYNEAELGSKPNEAFAETVLFHYKNNSLEGLLKRVNGIFIIVIYDQKNQQLKLVTDRYGLKPFYLYARNNCLIFAPELKCFQHFSQFSLQIRKDVVDCFIDLEHLMGTTTWFDGVEVTVPSTIYTYSWKENSLITKKYWSWSSLKRSSISIENAVEEMASLLDRAIKLRAKSDARVGVGLSGGFDSRVILAAIHDSNPITYTFGTEESADVRFAKMVAEIAGVKNIHYDMRIDHWIQRRFGGIWKTDGMLNMYHMHYSHLMDELPKIMDINLSGFLGDGVMGSTYLNKKGKKFLNKRADEATARHYYGKHWKFSDPADSFFDIDKLDVYLIYNRGRRLTGLGMEEANKTIFQRLPFMDNNLMDFSYSMPDEYRDNSVVYHKALLMKYPEFYESIPHATSRVTIKKNPGLLHHGTKLFHKGLWIAKFKLGMATSFADVPNWIKTPETAALIRDILNPKTALYPNFTDIDFMANYVEPHLNGKGNYAKPIMGAVTMEIWLQQIINNKYRNPVAIDI